MPKHGRRDLYVDAGVRVAEYGLEYLSYTNVGLMCGVGPGAVYHQFRNIGGFEAFRAAVIDLAKQRRNAFIIGQLNAARPLPPWPLSRRDGS